MDTQANPNGDDMPVAIAFPKGNRGKFFKSGMHASLPAYLDDQIQTTLAKLAQAKGVELSAFVNCLSRKDIDLIELGR